MASRSSLVTAAVAALGASSIAGCALVLGADFGDTTGVQPDGGSSSSSAGGNGSSSRGGAGGSPTTCAGFNVVGGIFQATEPWNTPVDQLPKDTASDSITRWLAANGGWGSGNALTVGFSMNVPCADATTSKQKEVSSCHDASPEADSRILCEEFGIIGLTGAKCVSSGRPLGADTAMVRCNLRPHPDARPVAGCRARHNGSGGERLRFLGATCPARIAGLPVFRFRRPFLSGYLSATEVGVSAPRGRGNLQRLTV